MVSLRALLAAGRVLRARRARDRGDSGARPRPRRARRPESRGIRGAIAAATPRSVGWTALRLSSHPPIAALVRGGFRRARSARARRRSPARCGAIARSCCTPGTPPRAGRTLTRSRAPRASPASWTTSWCCGSCWLTETEAELALDDLRWLDELIADAAGLRMARRSEGRAAAGARADRRPTARLLHPARDRPPPARPARPSAGGLVHRERAGLGRTALPRPTVLGWFRRRPRQRPGAPPGTGMPRRHRRGGGGARPAARGAGGALRSAVDADAARAAGGSRGAAGIGARARWRSCASSRHRRWTRRSSWASGCGGRRRCRRIAGLGPGGARSGAGARHSRTAWATAPRCPGVGRGARAHGPGVLAGFALTALPMARSAAAGGRRRLARCPTAAGGGRTVVAERMAVAAAPWRMRGRRRPRPPSARRSTGWVRPVRARLALAGTRGGGRRRSPSAPRRRRLARLMHEAVRAAARRRDAAGSRARAGARLRGRGPHRGRGDAGPAPGRLRTPGDPTGWSTQPPGAAVPVAAPSTSGSAGSLIFDAQRSPSFRAWPPSRPCSSISTAR